MVQRITIFLGSHDPGSESFRDFLCVQEKRPVTYRAFFYRYLSVARRVFIHESAAERGKAACFRRLAGDSFSLPARDRKVSRKICGVFIRDYLLITAIFVALIGRFYVIFVVK